MARLAVLLTLGLLCGCQFHSLTIQQRLDSETGHPMETDVALTWHFGHAFGDGE